MENAEEILQCLDDFSKRKPKIIPRELEDYLAYVARTGDPVYQWSVVKSLFKEKLSNVITDFYETSPGLDIPHCPNVDPFNYDTLKNSLLEKLDSFSAAPFTVQRISELLTAPRKQYNRIDKFMRAIEKNVLVVSTREPGMQRHVEPENGEQIESMVNGSDNNSDYNVDVEMEDMSWKEHAEQNAVQPHTSSSEGHISVDDIEARLHAKQDISMDTQDKTITRYESVTPPELNVSVDDNTHDNVSVPAEITDPLAVSQNETTDNMESLNGKTSTTLDVHTDNATQNSTKPFTVIPEIRVEDAEMTEKKLSANNETERVEISIEVSEGMKTEEKSLKMSPEKSPIVQNVAVTPEDLHQSESNEIKVTSDVSTSSEESSSSSDNMDGNSNSPKTDNECHPDIKETDTCQINETPVTTVDKSKEDLQSNYEESSDNSTESTNSEITLQTDNYTISDVKSELSQIIQNVNKNDDNLPTHDDKISEDSSPLAKPEESESSIPDEATLTNSESVDQIKEA